VHPLRLWAFVLTGVWAACFAAALLTGFLLLGTSKENFAYDLTVLLGGPACFLVGTLLAIRWERAAVALLWLGSAAAALGLALRSGPYVGRYFLGMAFIVLPQVVVAALLTLHAKKCEKAEAQAKKGH